MNSIWTDDDFEAFFNICGGKENIVEVENCTTRLRVVLAEIERDGKKIYQKEQLQDLPGVKMIIERGNEIQLVIGMDVYYIEKKCREFLKI